MNSLSEENQIVLQNFLHNGLKVRVDKSSYLDFLSAVADTAPELRWASGRAATAWKPRFNIQYLIYVVRHYSTRYLACTYADNKTEFLYPMWVLTDNN